MISKKAIGLALAACVATSPVMAACYTSPEWAAAQVRILQTDLMAAALSCRDVPGRNFIADYNGFVGKHNPSLLSHSRVLQAHFQRIYGSGSSRQMDQFITTVANDASQRSMQAGNAYCDQARDLFLSVDRLDRRELEAFAAARADGLGLHGDVCAVSATSASVPVTPPQRAKAAAVTKVAQKTP